MKGWFASSVCVKEPRLLETQRMKEINAQHNTQDSTQAPQPKAISPSLLWPWNDHILLLFPHLHWEDKTHTELIVSPQTSDSHWFSLFFSKRRRALFNWQIRLPFLARLGYPKAFWVSGNAVICLIAHLSAWAGTEKDIVPSTILVLEKMPKSGSTLPSDMQYSKTGFSTGNLPSPQGSDADLWQLLMGEYSVMASFISHYLQSEEPISVLQQGHWEELIAGPVILSGVRCEESAILTPSTGLSF